MSQIFDAVVKQIRVVVTEEQNGGKKLGYHSYMATGHYIFIQACQEPGDVRCGHLPSPVPWQPCVQDLFEYDFVP